MSNDTKIICEAYGKILQEENENLSSHVALTPEQKKHIGDLLNNMEEAIWSDVCDESNEELMQASLVYLAQLAKEAHGEYTNQVDSSNFSNQGSDEWAATRP